jgi:uncharacterized protein
MAKIERLKVLGKTIEFNPVYLRPLPPLEDHFPAISSLALDVAGGCNLRCAYCAESMTLPRRKRMSRDILSRSIEMLFKKAKAGLRVSLHFGSGEPLLQPSTVRAAGKMAIQFAREQGRNLSLHLTTNGTHLNAPIIQWLQEDRWEVKISLDGPQEIHDCFRRTRSGKGTYGKIEGIVRELASVMPQNFSTTSVLCRGVDPAKVFYGIDNLGVRKIELVPVAAPKHSPFLLGEADLQAYRQFILDYSEKLFRNRKMPVNIRFRKRIQRVLGFGNSQIACGAGRTFFAAGPDGTLYPCFRFVGIKEFKMGHVDSGLQKKFVKLFVSGPGRPYSKRKECRLCWAAPLCDGPCFACVELIGEGSPPPGFCEMTKADCEGALWLAEILRKKDPKQLISLMGINLGI